MSIGPDVLVIGSGPLGVAAARRLAEYGNPVRILEQGPAITDPPGSHIRNVSRFQADPDSYLNIATEQLSFFNSDGPRDSMPGAAVTELNGGQGVIWTNLCPRSDALWNALSREQWSEYYGIAETYLGVQHDWFKASIRQQRIIGMLRPELEAKGRNLTDLPVAAQPDMDNRLHFIAPHDILAGASDSSAQIEFVRGKADFLVWEGKRIIGASVAGEIVKADEIVVAAGAIGTPQLLHRSGIRPKALGRWLSYHPILICQLVLDEALCAAPGEIDREPRLQIRPSKIAEWYTLILRDVSPFQPEETDVDPNRLAEMQVICPVDVTEQNGIRFDEASQPTFSVPLSPDDEARISNAEAEAEHLSAFLGRYRRGCGPMWMPFGFAHMTGTTRMGAVNDDKSVTDYSGRVWGFENLHLATNGLIPTRMAVNPTLTGVALAIRVADKITNGRSRIVSH